MTGKPKPFLKWVGGKRQLLPELLKRLPERFGNYHEPFLGGGALFFELAFRKRFSEAFLSDMNPDLINAYEAVQSRLDALIPSLQGHVHDKEYYYALRAREVSDLDPVERASRTLYLNKTCYNGLYRVNSRGRFNVPFGSHHKPRICDEANLRQCAEALRHATLRRRPFEAVLEESQKGDLVYFDPPYDPLSKTASFASYSRDGFRTVDHERLREVFAALDAKGCFVMLSNSDTPFTRDLFGGYAIETVNARRAVNSRVAGRGNIPEILVRNYGYASPEASSMRVISEVVPTRMGGPQ